MLIESKPAKPQGAMMSSKAPAPNLSRRPTCRVCGRHEGGQAQLAARPGGCGGRLLIKPGPADEGQLATDGGIVGVTRLHRTLQVGGEGGTNKCEDGKGGWVGRSEGKEWLRLWT